MNPEPGELDRLIESQAAEFDETKRARAIQDVQRLLLRQLYVIPTITFAGYRVQSPGSTVGSRTQGRSRTTPIGLRRGRTSRKRRPTGRGGLMAYAELPGVRLWYTDSGGQGVPGASGTVCKWQQEALDAEPVRIGTQLSLK